MSGFAFERRARELEHKRGKLAEIIRFCYTIVSTWPLRPLVAFLCVRGVCLASGGCVVQAAPRSSWLSAAFLRVGRCSEFCSRLAAGVSMDVVGDLGARRAALTSAIAENRRRRKQTHAIAKATANAWQLTQDLRRSVLAVYVSSAYDAEPAARQLANIGRARKWPTITEASARKMVEDLFLEADVGELAGLSGPHGPTDSPAMRAAAKISEEWKLVVWARRQNADKGVAPCTDHLLQRVADNRLALGHASPQERGTVADGAARMWATRFRRRWGGRFGSIAAREEVSVDEVVSKARAARTSTHVV